MEYVLYLEHVFQKHFFFSWQDMTTRTTAMLEIVFYLHKFFFYDSQEQLEDILCSGPKNR